MLCAGRDLISFPADAATSAHDLGCETQEMPWFPDDAERHTRNATTWTVKELWAKVATQCLERTSGDGRAIGEANAVIARQAETSY